jgi:hypothetical protein
MKTAAELKVLYQQAFEAMGGNPDTADPDLARAFHYARSAWLRQERLEQGIPEPPPPIPKSKRQISMFRAVTSLTNKLGRILSTGVLVKELHELADILGSTPGPEADRYRERIAASLDSLARRASAEAASLRRSLP